MMSKTLTQATTTFLRRDFGSALLKKGHHGDMSARVRDGIETNESGPASLRRMILNCPLTLFLHLCFLLPFWLL